VILEKNGADETTCYKSRNQRTNSKRNLQKQIEKNKGCKERCPESRKSRKRLRKCCEKNIDWEYFFTHDMKASNLGVKVKLKGETMAETIIKKGGNIKLWDHKKLKVWEAFYLEEIDKFTDDQEKCNKETMKNIFNQKIMPKEFHYNPFSESSRDGFERIRCMWIMFAYFESDDREN
jgi:hypothetical protein